MRGFNSVTSTAIFMCGHALTRNIHRRFYPVVESVPQRLILAWTWNGWRRLYKAPGAGGGRAPLSSRN